MLASSANSDRPHADHDARPATIMADSIRDGSIHADNRLRTSGVGVKQQPVMTAARNTPALHPVPQEHLGIRRPAPRNARAARRERVST